MREQAVIPAPFGFIRLEANERVLIDISVGLGEAIERVPRHELLHEAVRQLIAYFDDPHQIFSLPMETRCTRHQQKVWRFIAAIPVGATMTYARLAQEAETGARAAASACRANPFPIVIPCHRVVGSHGLGGYCGDASGPFVEIKRWLLRHEGHEPTI